MKEGRKEKERELWKGKKKHLKFKNMIIIDTFRSFKYEILNF